MHNGSYLAGSIQRAQAMPRFGNRAGHVHPTQLSKERAVVILSDSAELPTRFVAGADAMAAVEANLKTIQAQIDAHRDLSEPLTLDDRK